MKACDGCGEKFPDDELSTDVQSVIHTHPAAHKGQKRIGVDASFRNVETGKPAELCQPCQHLVLSGMYNGRNWKQIKK